MVRWRAGYFTFWDRTGKGKGYDSSMASCAIALRRGACSWDEPVTRPAIVQLASTVINEFIRRRK
jgi:hypothetical protein